MLRTLMRIVPAVVLVLATPILAESPEQPVSKIKIVLAGDSTVTDKAGWGKAFADLLNENATCVNLARGGRSSRSYYDEGVWRQCLEEKPDYILIQFGHNDQPGKGPERETEPGTSYRNFMMQYVQQARNAGIQPVLVTSLTRRNFGEDGKIVSTLTPYVEEVRKIGSELKVPVVDLHRRSIELCERLGPEGCERISPLSEKGQDRTHLNEAGAKLIAPLVIDELARVEPALQAYAKKIIKE